MPETINLTGPQREFCRTFPNQREAAVPGVHFVQGDSPGAIGAAIAEWCAGFVIADSCSLRKSRLWPKVFGRTEIALMTLS